MKHMLCDCSDVLSSFIDHLQFQGYFLYHSRPSFVWSVQHMLYAIVATSVCCGSVLCGVPTCASCSPRLSVHSRLSQRLDKADTRVVELKADAVVACQQC